MEILSRSKTPPFEIMDNNDVTVSSLKKYFQVSLGGPEDQSLVVFSLTQGAALCSHKVGTGKVNTLLSLVIRSQDTLFSLVYI